MIAWDLFDFGIEYPSRENLLTNSFQYTSSNTGLLLKNLKIEFSASNGREVEFYSSMIFSIEVKIKSKLKNFISGGRYDQLTTNLGFRKVSAVGAAVNMNLYD